MDTFDINAFRSQPLPSEAQIMSDWNPADTTPAVSIICMTYNQLDYIHDAIRGFLIQKTNFPFEIIIHDDASTDGTRQIVTEYAQRYPHIIRTILQAENQYSQYPSSVFLFPARIARGQYLALCEGDDFFIDSRKLQIQYELARQNPDCRLFFHPFIEYNYLSTPPTEQVVSDEFIHQQTRVSTKRIIREGGGMMHTTGMLIAKDVVAELPDWYRECPVFDYVLKIVAAGQEGALTSPQVMSLYRYGAAGSWTKNLATKYIRFAENQEVSLQRLQAWIAPPFKGAIRWNRSRLAVSTAQHYASLGERTQAITYALRAIWLGRWPKGRALAVIGTILLPTRWKKAFRPTK